MQRAVCIVLQLFTGVLHIMSNRIERLQELALRITDPSTCSEEFPKRLVYVYYCDVCNSVLALRDRLEHSQSFLYTTADKCPTCHFELTTSLKCRALNIRLRSPLLSANKQKRSLTPDSNLQLLLDKKATEASLPKKEKWAERLPLSFGDNLLDELCGGVHTGQLTVLHGEKNLQNSDRTALR